MFFFIIIHLLSSYLQNENQSEYFIYNGSIQSPHYNTWANEYFDGAKMVSFSNGVAIFSPNHVLLMRSNHTTTFNLKEIFGLSDSHYKVGNRIYVIFGNYKIFCWLLIWLWINMVMNYSSYPTLETSWPTRSPTDLIRRQSPNYEEGFFVWAITRVLNHRKNSPLESLIFWIIWNFLLD